MRPRLTKEQRDALYDLILCRFIAIGDVWSKIEAEKFSEADRLAREYADLLRLIVDDLGWGAEGEAVQLTMPAEDLHRAFGRFHERAARAFLVEESEEAEARVAREESQLVLDACKEVFTTLDVRAM